MHEQRLVDICDSYVNFAKEREFWTETLTEIDKKEISEAFKRAFKKIDKLEFKKEIYDYCS
jgi:hypothetical protein